MYFLDDFYIFLFIIIYLYSYILESNPHEKGLTTKTSLSIKILSIIASMVWMRYSTSILF